MIDSGIIVLVALTAVLVLGAVAFGCFVAHWYITKDTRENGPLFAPPKRGKYDDFEVYDDEDEEEMPALKIDPENPPTWKIYRGNRGPHCNCHDKRIEYGENILMWPDPEEPGAYRLFHEGFVKGMVPPR